MKIIRNIVNRKNIESIFQHCKYHLIVVSTVIFAKIIFDIAIFLLKDKVVINSVWYELVEFNIPNTVYIFFIYFLIHIGVKIIIAAFFGSFENKELYLSFKKTAIDFSNALIISLAMFTAFTSEQFALIATIVSFFVICHTMVKK